MERYHFTEAQRALMESSKVPFAIYQFVDQKVVTLAISDGFCELFDYADRAEAYDDMDHDMYKYDHPDDIARIGEAAVRFAVEGGDYDVIYRTRNRRGEGYRVVHAKGAHAYTETGARIAYVWYIDEGDYDEDTNAGEIGLNQSLNNALHTESLLKANRFDYLTGLPSMTYFFELAEKGKARIQGAGGVPVFLYMDLNGMKFFNQKYGFAEGDKYLQAFARLLSQRFSSENCCRLGQDHFGVYTCEAKVEDMLTRLFREAKALNGGEALTLRVGIYSTRMGDVAVSFACDRAKIACDAIRGAYESAFNYYSQALKEEITQRQYILNNLDRALSERWVRVWYQPIIRAVNGRVCDEEALARWIDPVKGFLSPGDFIPYLEDAGLIYKLDLYVLDRVLEEIEARQRAGLILVNYSINLSRSDFIACDMVEEVCRRVDDAGVDRHRISIEITESAIGADMDFMKTQVERFRTLGFPVWMDDFGAGYSSLDVLQSIRFDLIKFDMSFMRKLDEGESGKIVLTELMKLTTALGVDTVCEGVETEQQVKFLREIGCSKLQGYYYCKPMPLEKIIERYENGEQIGFEDPAEAGYYEMMGRVNLYDLAVIAADSDGAFQNFFNSLPMGVIEIHGDTTRFVRSNQPYRDFVRRYLGFDLSYMGSTFARYDDSFMFNVVRTCCEKGVRAFYDERMPDGSVVHSFARRIGHNPVNGNDAVAVAVLSITRADEGTTYARIARALAADYYNLYYVDLETDKYIEYSSPVGGEEMAIERHGEDFFNESRRESDRIYAEDREAFFAIFTKENIVRELDRQGLFTATYRVVETGAPMYVHMKIVRMLPDARHIIIGISIIDAQMKQNEALEEIRRERDALTRVMALTEDYLSLYTVDQETGHYIQYTASDEFESIGLAVTGEDFFAQSVVDGRRVIHPEDLQDFERQFTRENILKTIQEKGVFKMEYRLVIHGHTRPVSLKIAPFRENGQSKLFAGIRAWRERR